MIQLTRMGGLGVLVNEDWLECVEANPDTTLIFASGTKLLVKEGVPEVLDMVLAWDAKRAGAKRRSAARVLRGKKG